MLKYGHKPQANTMFTIDSDNKMGLMPDNCIYMTDSLGQATINVQNGMTEGLRYDMGDQLLNATVLRNGGNELLTMSELTALTAEQQAEITISLTNTEQQAIELAKRELPTDTSATMEKAEIEAYMFQKSKGEGASVTQQAQDVSKEQQLYREHFGLDFEDDNRSEKDPYSMISQETGMESMRYQETV